MGREEKQRKPNPDLGPWLRVFSGLVGLVLIAFGVFSGIRDDPNTIAGVSLVLGSLFLILAIMGSMPRMTIKGAGAEATVEPVPPEPTAQPEKLTDQRSPPPERAETEIRETVEGVPVSTDGSPEVETKEKPAAKSPFVEALDAMIEKDYEQFDSKMEEAIAAEKDDERRLSLRALRLSYLYSAGRTEKLEELHALRAEHPESHYPLIWLGDSFEVAEDYTRAAALYGEALAIDTLKEEHRLTLLRRHSKALAKAKEFQEAEEKLLGALAEMTSAKAQGSLRTMLADLYEKWDKLDLFHWHLKMLSKRTLEPLIFALGLPTATPTMVGRC